MENKILSRGLFAVAMLSAGLFAAIDANAAARLANNGSVASGVDAGVGTGASPANAPEEGRPTFADTVNVLDDAVVTGTRTRTLSGFLPQTITVVGREQLSQARRTNLLPTMGELVPGLFLTSRAMLGYGVSGGAAGGISIRGLAGGSGQMMVLVNGHPQYSGIFSHPVADSYQTIMAERVEVLRGPASVLYGSNAMGGVINIITRQATEDGVRTDINLGAGSYGTIQGSVASRMRSGKLSGAVSAQYARSDNHRPRMGFEQYGGAANVGYDFSEHWRAVVDANVTHFNASYPGTVSSPLFDADQWITRGVASAAVENHYGATDGAMSIYCNFGFHKINDGHAADEDAQTSWFRSEDALAGVSLWQSLRLFRGNVTTLGLDWQNIRGKAWYQVIASGEDLDPLADKAENDIAGYIDFRQDLTPWLTVDAGLRVDRHSQSGTELIPQGGVAARVFGGELKAMVSKGFRRPSIREMYLWRPANADLEPERVMNYELAWKSSVGGFTYGLNAFYLKGDNLIQSQMVDGRPLNVNVGEVENLGLEFDGRWRFHPSWTALANASWLRMENKVISSPEGKVYAGLCYAGRRLSLTLGGQQLINLYTAVGEAESKVNVLLVSLNAHYGLTPWLRLWVRGENLLAQEYEVIAGYPMPRATVMAGIDISI